MAKYFVWAGNEFNRRLGDQHYLVVGASGSGKTTLINHVLHSIATDPSVRSLVYDPKQELVPFLLGLRGIDAEADRLTSSIKILQPFDSRSTGWDMASDIDSPLSARQLATILIPDAESGGGTDSFFTNAVRDILTGVILAFIECVPNRGSWRFRDVLLALLYDPYLQFVLEMSLTRDGADFPMLDRIRETYFGEQADSRTRSNIRSTINAKLAVFEPVAAAWHKAEKSQALGGLFSLSSWIDERPSEANPGSILVLGNDEAARAALDPINHAFFKRASELVLARRERTSQERETGVNQIWFVLDEVREAGRLDGLGRLLTKGRSKDVCILMGFQDIDGLREVYGKEAANEMCAQFNNIAVLRVNSPETAQWASDLFGRRIEEARNTSTGLSESGLTINEGRSEEERPFFHTDTFLHGTNAAKAKGVFGFRKGPDLEIGSLSREKARASFRFEERTEAPINATSKVREKLISGAAGLSENEAARLVSAFDARPITDQYLEPWNDADWARLGFTCAIPRWKAQMTVAETAQKRVRSRMRVES